MLRGQCPKKVRAGRGFPLGFEMTFTWVVKIERLGTGAA